MILIVDACSAGIARSPLRSRRRLWTRQARPSPMRGDKSNVVMIAVFIDEDDDDD